MDKEKDYEALGRYTDAKQRVDKLENERHNMAIDIEKVLRSARIYPGGGAISRYDHAEVVRLVHELGQINMALEKAIGDMNAYAEMANMPEVRRG